MFGLTVLYGASLLMMMKTNAVDYCLTDGDCGDVISSVGRGRSCVRLYDGCLVGHCMCRSEHQSTLDSEGRCVDIRAGLEVCGNDSRCRPSMTCRDGLCQCKHGSHMTADHQYCLADHEKLLNDKCLLDRHVCLHLGADGYTRNDIRCTFRSRCECHKGFKSDGIRCRHWNIGEFGCSQSHHCTGGAVCYQRRCVCPVGYTTIASGTKCARRGATLNVQQGARCDEINEHSYCSQGLVCHKCPGDTAGYKCVRFLLEKQYAHLLNSSRSFIAYHLITVTLLLAVFSSCTLQYVLR